MTTDTGSSLTNMAFGIGANAEGHIEVLTPEEAARRRIQRNAEEALDDQNLSDEQIEAMIAELSDAETDEV